MNGTMMGNVSNLAGHRHKVLIKKGYTIEQCLNGALEELVRVYPDVSYLFT